MGAFKPLLYKEAQPFTDPVAQAAFSSLGLPLTAFVGGTGILVHGTINTLNPANQIPLNNQVIASVYGEGVYPVNPPVLQVLSSKPPVGNL